jgi:cytoskeletal protein RodZ
MLTQALIAFMIIALLALVLKWAFARDARHTPWPPAREDVTGGELRTGPDVSAPNDAPASTEPTSSAEATPEAAATATGGRDERTASVRGGPAHEPAVREDYGLLAPVARVATAEQADEMRAVLARDGIRATRARGADGRYRVLVFASELHRARRIAGGS